MQDKEFGSSFLFFPAVVGDERIPDGLPQGRLWELSSAISLY